MEWNIGLIFGQLYCELLLDIVCIFLRNCWTRNSTDILEIFFNLWPFQNLVKLYILENVLLVQGLIYYRIHFHNIRSLTKAVIIVIAVFCWCYGRPSLLCLLLFLWKAFIAFLTRLRVMSIIEKIFDYWLSTHFRVISLWSKHLI